MKTTLKSLSEIVKKEENTDQSTDCSLDLIWKYNDFLKQPLTLSMFIPTDKNGEPLIEPKVFDYTTKEYMNGGKFDYLNRYEEYQKAKDRCLFEGYSLDGTFDNEFVEIIGKDYYDSFVYDRHHNTFYNHWDKIIKSISDLCGKGVKLTLAQHNKLNL